MIREYARIQNRTQSTFTQLIGRPVGNAEGFIRFDNDPYPTTIEHCYLSRSEQDREVDIQTMLLELDRDAQRLANLEEHGWVSDDSYISRCLSQFGIEFRMK